MGTVIDRKKNEYCDEVLSELAYMIHNIQDMRTMLGSIYDRDSAVFRVHDRHLAELADLIDWKLQILTTACPFDWKGLGPDVQSEVSVRQPELSVVHATSGGYLGG